MKLSHTVLIPLLAASVVQASVIDYRLRKREFVTMVTTVDLSLSDFLEALANPAPATTTTPAAAQVTTPATPAAAVAAAATTPAATTGSSSSSGGGFLSNLWGKVKGFLDGDSSSSSTPAPALNTAPAASANTAPTAAVATTTSAFFLAPTSSSSNGFFPAATSSSSSSAPSSSSSSDEFKFTGGGGLTGNAAAAVGAGGISYSPYTKGGQCKSASQVQHDINLLSSFKLIRLYGVDCSGVENVLAAMSSSQQLFVGIYNIDSYNINQDLTILKNAVAASSRGWSAVHTVSIGNELVNAGSASASQIVTAMQNARSWFKANAPTYSGALVSVDTLVAVLNNPSLCDASDYLAVNCHPYWDGGVQPGNSGPWLQQQIANLKSKCNNNKDILITESGWPTQGQAYGSCVPSESNQLSALKSIVGSLGTQVLAFTTYNDYWKDGGSYGVEKYWGIFGDPSA